MPHSNGRFQDCRSSTIYIVQAQLLVCSPSQYISIICSTFLHAMAGSPFTAFVDRADAPIEDAVAGTPSYHRHRVSHFKPFACYLRFCLAPVKCNIVPLKYGARANVCHAVEPVRNTKQRRTSDSSSIIWPFHVSRESLYKISHKSSFLIL